MCHALDVEHGDDGSVFGGELSESSVEALSKVSSAGFLVGAGACAHTVENGLFGIGMGFVQADHRAEFPFFEEVEGHVVGDGSKPRAELALSPKPIQRDVDSCPNVLKDILGVGGVEGHVEDVNEQPVGVFGDEAFECVGVTCLDAID